MKEVTRYGETEIERFDDDTEVLCLNFANTADWHAGGQPEELLRSYGDLLTWAGMNQIVTGEEAALLHRLAQEDPAQAEYARQKAVRLREAMYQLFVAAAGGQPLPADDLTLLNEALPRALGQLRLAAVHGGVEWQWAESEALDRVLAPAVRSAAELLTSDRLYQVGQCQDDRGCGWLFLDHSRNHSRRWCSMDRCGNRAKARRHYRRMTKGR